MAAARMVVLNIIFVESVGSVGTGEGVVYGVVLLM